VQRPDAPERDPGQIEIEHRERKLERGPQPNAEAGDAPEDGSHRRKLYRAHIVIGLVLDSRWRQLRRALVVAIDDRKYRRNAGGGGEPRVKGIFRSMCARGDEDRGHRQGCEGERRSALADGHAFSRDGRRHHVVASMDSPGRFMQPVPVTRNMMRCGKVSFDADQNADHTETDRRDRGRSTAAAKSVPRCRGLRPVLYPLHDEGHEHKDSAEPGDIFNCLQQNRRFQPPY
jgi:hypothetical protein